MLFILPADISHMSRIANQCLTVFKRPRYISWGLLIFLDKLQLNCFYRLVISHRSC